MAIPIIQRGDTSREITLSLAEGYEYGGCTLEVEFNGVERSFTGLVAGGTIELSYTADETADMPLGTGRVLLSIRNAAGMVRQLPWAKIKVTDAPSEVYAAAITVDPSSLDVEDATAGDSLGAVKSKLNAVLAFLRGVAVLAVCALPCLGETVQPLYTTPNDMPGDAPLMTNAAEYVDAKVAAATNGLADKADAAYSAAESLADGVNSLAGTIGTHIRDTKNPHKVTAAQVGAYTKKETNDEISNAIGNIQFPVPYVPTKVGEFENDAGYVTETVTNGLATAESVDGLAAEVAGKADAAAVYAKDEADARFYPADEGALWASWWSGDGFRVAVSNYDVAASSAAWDRLPSASFDYRPGGTGALVRVWSEITRWERHRAEAAAFSNAVERALAGKAGLDWGRTTPTGFDAPEGFTWLDTPAVAVAGGLAWQRTATSEGAVWLLCSNGMVAEAGGATNGSFRVVDMATGEAAFEVVQGDRRTVGANCGEVYTWTAADGKTHLRVVYNVASDDPPVLHVAEALKPQGGTAWHDEGAEGCPAQFAGWTGSSGAWTNALWRASAPAAGAADALFCFATYETGGETVVKNHAPVSMSKIVVGGVTYALGTATVGGHTVLTLTEAQ